jgi:hypothetical protein
MNKNLFENKNHIEVLKNYEEDFNISLGFDDFKNISLELDDFKDIYQFDDFNIFLSKNLLQNKNYLDYVNFKSNYLYFKKYLSSEISNQYLYFKIRINLFKSSNFQKFNDVLLEFEKIKVLILILLKRINDIDVFFNLDSFDCFVLNNHLENNFFI